MTTFSFFHGTSMVLANLLERTELFSVSQEIQEQLILTFADLVTLVASMSTHYHKAIRGLTTASVSVDIYATFSAQIQTFRQRCEKVVESMWRHQLIKDNLDGDKGDISSSIYLLIVPMLIAIHLFIVSEVNVIRSWLAPEDPVLKNTVETTSHLAHEREELTCLWLGQHLDRFLKSPSKNLCITGKPGSGKTVLASVIIDQLQHPIGGVSYMTLFVPISKYGSIHPFTGYTSDSL